MSNPGHITEFLHGPFVIVVTDPLHPLDRAYPMVVGPEGGYATTDEALKYIELHFARRKEPYLGLRFDVAPLRTEIGFVGFCSWED